MEEKIKQWLNELGTMDCRDHSDLWDDRPDTRSAEMFFKSLESLLPHKEIQNRLAVADLTGNAYQVYQILNSPGHPVRDGMILLSNGLEP